MKKMSSQWRLTCIITIYIALICGCLTMFVYRNGVYYIDSLQEAVEAQGDKVEITYVDIGVPREFLLYEFVL